MSVNAPNIFLVPLAPLAAPLPAGGLLVIDAGIDWPRALASPDLKALCEHCPSPLYLRIEGLPDTAADHLAGLLGMGIDGIVLGACAGTAHLQHLETVLRVAEAQAGRTDGATPVMVELGGAPEAFLPPRPLASARLSAVIFNEDASFAGGMRALAQLMAAQAGKPFYVLSAGDRIARLASDP
ncbi:MULTISPECIES: hypothetical protein [unclassified Rhizobium]|uniref:hypothetical protein n=1 Tax=unclassified Rhizobium TaxID=2613769 RepID=UPI0007005E44|nr:MULTISPECIES: hypothetical protein [unclassified Rhizobium]KQV42523.1 hypothetical protein ASC86_19515 [Rhizobium sp. Root1212]KRD21447.1 hypothetical protein ASE37_18080 [Rhizobium sp. Root268]